MHSDEDDDEEAEVEVKLLAGLFDELILFSQHDDDDEVAVN